MKSKTEAGHFYEETFVIKSLVVHEMEEHGFHRNGDN